MKTLHYKHFSTVFMLLLATTLSGCATAASSVQNRVFTVGIISGTQTNSVNTLGQSFKLALGALGYIDGKNLKFIDKGVLTKADTLDAGLKDLVDAKVDAMLVLGTTAATEAKKTTDGTGIPVVFAPGGDPVDLGLVQSLTNPGGNMTGLKTGFFYPAESIQYMQQIKPDLKNVLVIYDPTGQGNKFISTLNTTGTKLNVNIVLKTVSTNDDVTAAFANIPDNIDAVLNIPDNAVNARIKDLIAATLKRNIPLITVDETTLAAGALLSYAWNPDAMAKQVAQITDQILKGTKPGTIPIQAGEFYIGVNLKTATAINITIPDSVLKQATTIIR